MMLLLALFLALVPIAAQASEDVSTPNVDPASDWEKSSAPEAREELPHQATASQCCDMEILKGALSELVQEQREARGWYAEMVKVLTQLVQENKELGSSQMEVLKVLRVMKDQQEQQLSHLMSFARLQSLLVENHQALLFQVSRISSQIQEVTKKPSLAKPVIRLNSTTLSDPAVVLASGTSFSLSCEGQADVFWKTRRNQYKKHKNTLIVRPSTADDTGTYRCSYKNQSHLYSQVHIYVKDPAQPFTTPLSKAIVEREGSECLLDCLPTDPKATDLSLRLANRSVVHPEMKFTANPKEGIRIWNLRSYHSGDYVCTVNLNSRQRTSAVFQITVIERVKRPPSVVTEQEELVRVVGEQLHIICHVSNPDHSCHVMWQHSSKKKLHAENKVNSSSNPVVITSVLTLRDISVSDSGNLSCIANNTAGQTRATVSLRVVDKPYAHLMPAHTSRVSMELREGDLLELAVLVDAYPAVQQRWWETPRVQNKSTYEESFHRIHKSYRCIATLSLRRIRADESGWYIFSVRSNSITSSIRFEVHVYQKPSVVVKWRNGTLVCIASANPAPTLRWYRCGNLHPTGDRCNTSPYPKVELQARQYTVEPWEKFKPQQVESILERNLIVSNTTIECVAVNSVGEGYYTVQTGDLDISSTMSKQWFSRIFIAVLTGSSVVTTLLLLVLGVGIYRWKQKPRYEIRWKIIEANDGNNYTYIDPSQLLYNTEWEFPRDRLRFGQVLGAGAFGKVVEATAFGLDDDERATRVAVKMLKSGAHSEEREALMSELKILSHLGPHCNIVNLLGACTHGGPVLLITEYCCNGDLLNFLRRRAQMFVNSTFQDQGLSQLYRNLPVQAAFTSYQDKQPTHRIMDASQGGEKGLDMERLLRFAGQVAHGMDFLASKKCIHRDLAARNVLVTDCFVAKICDFGLARDIMNDSNYVVRGNVRLPVKWMPPESIFQCIYTSQSDVWSYGILLWEIFSLGQTPYPDIAVDTRFYEMIKGGYHMSQPDFAPSEMYSIMKQCWSLDPGLRPAFSTVLQCITKLLPELNSSLTEPHYKNLHQELQQKLKSMQCVTAQDNADRQDQTPCHEEHEALLDQTLHCEERKDVFNQTQPHEECEGVCNQTPRCENDCFLTRPKY